MLRDMIHKEATDTFVKEIDYLLNDFKILYKGYKIAKD